MRGTTLLGLALVLGSGCDAGEESPYSSYCPGTYEELDPSESTSLGYSAQEAIDRHGLAHTGVLSWSLLEEPGYPLALPPDSTVAVDLAVDKVRWGTYEFDSHHRWIIVQCPVEGLEVWVSGTLLLEELALELPVQGHLLASRSEAGDVPALDDLAFGISRELRSDEVAPFLPTLDGFASGEGFTYEGLKATLNLAVGSRGGSASLQVTWDEGHAISDRAMPFEPALALSANISRAL